MEVCSLELAKELYKTSGWSGNLELPSWPESPAYTLGYLLRKLPENYLVTLVQTETDKKLWVLGHRYKMQEMQDKPPIYADTPEDAVAKLLIKLIEAKVITI
jgi:hypothetical protein